MDKITTFIQTMTFWNCIALIAFLIALFSGLNAFFSLRSRYRDWRGTKNKKEFDHRTEKLKRKILKLAEYKENPMDYFVAVSSFVVRCLTLMLFSIACLTSAFLLERMYSIQSGLIMFLFSILFVLLGMVASFKISSVVMAMNAPGTLAVEVIDFVSKGSKKGLTTDEADELIVLLADSGLFVGAEKRTLRNYVHRKYPRMLGKITPKLEPGN